MPRQPITHPAERIPHAPYVRVGAVAVRDDDGGAREFRRCRGRLWVVGQERIDRDAVIIAPTGTDENGITITSGTETSRSNTIRNLTIRTTDGHGIEIVEGTATPRDIVIESCVIAAAGEGKDGILGPDAEDVLVTRCDVESDTRSGIDAGDRWTIRSTSVRARANGTPVPNGLDIRGDEGVRVIQCDVFSEVRAVRLGEDTTDLVFSECSFRSDEAGGPFRATIMFFKADNVLFERCVIHQDATNGSGSEAHGIFGDLDPSDDITFDSCFIKVEAGTNVLDAIGFKQDQTGVYTFRDCLIRTSNTGDPENPQSRAAAYGIQQNNENDTLIVTGGAILTSSSRERERQVLDIGDQELAAPAGPVHISGTRLSKWGVPIGSAERARSVVQRVIDAGPADPAGIRAATTLGASEKEVTPTFQPDVYRVISATGDTNGMDQTVYVIGTNFAGDRIADEITLDDEETVDGRKPFATITEIILPEKKTDGEAVSIGITNGLGLYFPIDDVADIVQHSVLVSSGGGEFYEVQSPLVEGRVDTDFSTVWPSISIGGDSFEFVVLSSQ